MEDNSAQWQFLDKVDFPCIYPFKFVVKTAQLGEIQIALKDFDTKTKFSKKGNYVAVSFQVYMLNPEMVKAIYSKLSGIEGIISL